MEHIAILGAGRMGCGIAQVFLAAGHAVALYDTHAGALEAAPVKIKSFFDLLGQNTAALELLQCHGVLASAVADADVVIEAAPEKLELKIDLFRQVETSANATAVLVSNTSAIPIASIASGVKDKSRFLGMHFWNPPHLVPLVEVIQTELTAAPVIAHAMRLLHRAGMEPVHVLKDIPGFIGNRLQHALKREAIALVANGICDAMTVDKVVKTGFGARLPVLGPLEQSDLVGLELTLNIHKVLIEDLDVTRGPHPYLQAKVAAGETGMRAGRGFYDWTPEQSREVQERLDHYLLQAARERIKNRMSS